MFAEHTSRLILETSKSPSQVQCLGTLNPETYTLNPKSETLRPKPYILNPTP